MTPEEKIQWTEMITGYRNRLNNVRIPPNIEPGQAKDILSRLDSLYAEVRIIFGDVLKNAKEIERWIYRIENKNKTGSNEGSRRSNMVTAVENASRGNGMTVNLYELEEEAMQKKEDVEAILEVVDKKCSMIITMNGLLKVESTFV
jgi:hypothetical protein